jgi:hypothetical protein
LHAMGKEELPRGGVVELVLIIVSDTLDLVVELSTDKREQLSDSRKDVRLHTQRKTTRIVEKIKDNKIILKT